MRLRLTARVFARSGGLFAAGEIVAFAPDVAADLLARGVGVVALDPITAKAPEAPPADKMIGGQSEKWRATVQKKR